MEASSSATAREVSLPVTPRVPRPAQVGGGTRKPFSEWALFSAARFWFVVAVSGQWIFTAYILAFYGSSAVRGHFEEWNNALPQGWVAGNPVANLALSAHLLFAAAITFAGTLQLMPLIRRHYPVLHRWTGRLYVGVALVMGCSGLYLGFSGRKVVGDASQHAATFINAILILGFAMLALRTALARDFVAHRRWALRLFLVVNGVWFFRVEVMAWLAINQRPVGYDDDTFVGPFLTLAGFGQFLIPLAMLQLYMHMQARGTPQGRIATAGALSLLTVVMGVGVFAATTRMWWPMM